MNCAYHSQNVAVVNCNGCGKPLCPACDHRIKGFPLLPGLHRFGCRSAPAAEAGLIYVRLLRNARRRVIATLLSIICPGLGAAYNGQTTKALVYFAVFVGLFQMAVLTAELRCLCLDLWECGLFAALDSWRTAQMIRSGVTPDVAEDILVRRFSGNPKLWGIVLAVLGVHSCFNRLLHLDS